VVLAAVDYAVKVLKSDIVYVHPVAYLFIAYFVVDEDTGHERKED